MTEDSKFLQYAYSILTRLNKLQTSLRRLKAQKKIKIKDQWFEDFFIQRLVLVTENKDDQADVITVIFYQKGMNILWIKTEQGIGET